MKKIFIVMLAALVLTLCLTACGGEGDSQTTTGVTTTTNPVTTTKAPEDFNDAFVMRDVEFVKHEFSTSQSASFVGLTTDDTLDLVEFGYEDDTVSEVYKMFYLNVDGYDASQRESIKQSMEANFADAAAIECVTITHEITDKYYIMTTEIKALDNADNLSAVISEGLLDFAAEGISSLKMSEAEDVLTANGFIKM